MKALLGLVLIICLCRCSQKHPVISTEPFFFEGPPTDKAVFTSDESPLQQNRKRSREFDSSYRKIHRLWNEDKNREALDLAIQISGAPEFLEKSKSAQLAHHQLTFQIAYDLQDLDLAQKSFDAMEALLPCSDKRKSNTFALALLYYAARELTPALRLLKDNTCGEEISTSESLQKNYWLYRVSEDENSNKKKYLKDLGNMSSVPHFYTVLASLLENKTVGPLESLQNSPSEFPSKVRVSPQLKEKLVIAENKLKARDRVGSLESLFQVKSELQKSSTQYPEALLYVSRLFQANGEHLESMKIVNPLVENHPSPLAQQEWLETFHRPFEEEVNSLCRRWDVDPDLVYSLIRQESAFNPAAHSIAGARGLVQLMPVLSKFILEQWRVPIPKDKDYLFQVKANLPIAIYHLHQLQQVFPHPALIAAAYNAGVQRVHQWTQRFGQFPLDVFTEFVPVKETRDYIKYVMRNLWVYKRMKKSRLYSKSHQRAGRGDELCLSTLEVLTGTPCIQ